MVSRVTGVSSQLPASLAAAARAASTSTTLFRGGIAPEVATGTIARELLALRLRTQGGSAEAIAAVSAARGARGDAAGPAFVWRGANGSTAKEDFLDALQLAEPVRDEVAELLDPALVLSIVALSTAQRLATTADLCTAMHLDAIRGELGAFDDRLHSLGRPYPGQITAASNVRELLRGSEFTTDRGRAEFGGDSGARVQDAISLRAVPQTHGAVRDAISRLERKITTALSGRSGVNQALALTHEVVGIALIDLANISQHRSYRLLDSKMSYGLPMNLMGENAGYNHGFPIVHTSAIAILAEMKLHTPRSFAAERVDPISGTIRDFSFEAASRTLVLLDYLQKILSIEAFMSAQAMDLTERTLKGWRFGVGTAAAHAAIRASVPYIDQNRFASDDMVAVEQLIASGRVTEAAAREVANLV